MRQAKKIVAAAAKAKKEKEDKNFFCPPELVEWEKAGKLGKKLRDHTTANLKGFCQWSNIRYDGPKYELVGRLLEHAKDGRLASSR